MIQRATPGGGVSCWGVPRTSELLADLARDFNGTHEFQIVREKSVACQLPVNSLGQRHRRVLCSS